MATLTYDPAESQEGEFTPEEQENIKVGEALEEQQGELLAGKFKDAEDLEKGYIELQKKLGEPREEPEEKTTKAEEEEEKKEDDEPPDTAFLDKLWDQAVENNFSEETLEELAKMDPREVAHMHLQYRNENTAPPMNQETVSQLKSVAGSPEAYDTMIGWAKTNLHQAEIDMYDKVMDKGDPLACYFAVQALKYRYDDASGVDGQVVTGKAPSNRGDAFRSQAEVVRAMKDPKYESDPAYRQDVYDKLERSKLEF